MMGCFGPHSLDDSSDFAPVCKCQVRGMRQVPTAHIVVHLKVRRFSRRLFLEVSISSTESRIVRTPMGSLRRPAPGRRALLFLAPARKRLDGLDRFAKGCVRVRLVSAPLSAPPRPKNPHQASESASPTLVRIPPGIRTVGARGGRAKHRWARSRSCRCFGTPAVWPTLAYAALRTAGVTTPPLRSAAAVAALSPTVPATARARCSGRTCW